MDFHSCVAKRTRSGTDLYLRTIFLGKGGRRVSSKASQQTRFNEEDRTSWCGSSSSPEVRKRGRKRKVVSFLESEDDEWGRESEEELGDSVLGSQLRIEKGKRGRFGPILKDPDVIFVGEKDLSEVEREDNITQEVIVLDDSDGSSDELACPVHQNETENVVYVVDDEEPFEMKEELEPVESIDLTGDDETNRFEVVGSGGRQWDSDTVGLGSFDLKSPVSKWGFDESNDVGGGDGNGDDETDRFEVVGSDETDQFEVAGSDGIPGRQWDSDTVGLGSFDFETPIVSKWGFDESISVGAGDEKEFDKGKKVLESDGGNDQDVSRVSPLPSTVGECSLGKMPLEIIDSGSESENDCGIGGRHWNSDTVGLGSFSLETPTVSKWGGGDGKESESLRNDKGKSVLECDGGNDQDVSRVSPMPSRVGECSFGKMPLEVSDTGSESENDSDVFSSSSSGSEDEDSQDEDYKANELEYSTSEDEAFSCGDDVEEISEFGEENDAGNQTEKEASVGTENEKKSNQIQPPLKKKRRLFSLENEEKLVTESKDMDVPIVEVENEDKEVEENMSCPIVEDNEKYDGAAMDKCSEEEVEKLVEAENETSPIYEKNAEIGDDGVTKEKCGENEEEKEVEAENAASPICEKNGETCDDGATKEECGEKEEEKEVEAENAASPICEKNGETCDDGATKEECGENEEEKEVEAENAASQICEKNGETCDDGATKEECGKKDEEKEVEAENEASPICEKNGKTRDDGGVKERCKEKEEEKVVETSSMFEKNDKTRRGGATKEKCREKEASKTVGMRVSGRESETKHRLRTRSLVKKSKIPVGKSIEKLGSKFVDTGCPTAASMENLKKVDISTKPAEEGEEKKEEKEHVDEGDKINDEFIVGREEQAQKTVDSSTKLFEKERKKEEEEDEEDEDEEEGNGDKANDHDGVGAQEEMHAENKTGPKGGAFWSKRKRASGLKDMNVFKLLLDSISEKGEALMHNLVSPEEETFEQDTNEPAAAEPLPLKFTFGVEEPEPVEKSEFEKELDDLWAEMDFALKSLEIGTSGVDDEETNEEEYGENFATNCRQGKHEFILDEEIGIKCINCSFLKVEIRYVLPPMANFTSEGSGKKNSYGEEDVSMFDGVQFQDLRSGTGDSCNHTKGTIWDIIPGIKGSMYPHQQEGFEFIWKNLAGSTEIDKLNSSDPDNVGGCIISHAPGTGKTRLTIVFLQTYLEMFPDCRPVIIAPASLLLTWEEEFKKWNVGVPFHNLNNLEFSGKESVAAVNVLNKSRHQTQDKNAIRMVKLFSWCQDKSILGVSYSLYEKLAGEKFSKDVGTNFKRKVARETENEKFRKILLNFPGLLVLDEGHTPRNQRSSIWKVLCELKTKKRIILSGTPFQNNFLELYNTLCLVRPGFADTIPASLKKLCQRRLMREKKVMKEVQDSISSSAGSHADEEIKKFKALMAPFVNVHKGSILQKSLPGLRDCVVVLNPPDMQKRLLESIQGTSNTFEFEHKLALASVHPSLFLDLALTKKEESILNKDWLESHRLNPNEGVKTRFLMEFIRLCDTLNEKVLVFSQFIDPLCLILDQLSSLLNWSEGRELLHMHGKLDQKTRQSMINKFNDPNSEAKVLLASTKACSEGINLVGASRVVLLDVVWNPSVERQAISRAYRIGQKKVVYTYHLITRGTTECDKYCKQAEKDRLSELVFSASNNENDMQKSSVVVSDDKVLDEMVRHEKLKDMFEKIIYQPKESDLVESFSSMLLP